MRNITLDVSYEVLRKNSISQPDLLAYGSLLPFAPVGPPCPNIALGSLPQSHPLKAGFQLNECSDSAEAACVGACVVGSNVDPLGYPRPNRLTEMIKWFELFH